MDNSANSLPCAKVLKSFGTQGAILVKLLSDLSDNLDKKEPVFIIYEGLPVPFFIKSIDYKGTNQAILHLDGISTKELAEEIIGRELLINDITTQHKNNTDMSYMQLTGMEVYDNQDQYIGNISNFYDYPNNPCIGITIIKDSMEREILIPFHKDLILEFNKKRDLLKMNLPEGLIDIY